MCLSTKERRVVFGGHWLTVAALFFLIRLATSCSFNRKCQLSVKVWLWPPCNYDVNASAGSSAGSCGISGSGPSTRGRSSRAWKGRSRTLQVRVTCTSAQVNQTHRLISESRAAPAAFWAWKAARIGQYYISQIAANYNIKLKWEALLITDAVKSLQRYKFSMNLTSVNIYKRVEE